MKDGWEGLGAVREPPLRVGRRERGRLLWEGLRGGMNPLRRCAPRPPFASLRCAKRGGVVVSRAIWDPTSWLGGVLLGLRE